MNKQYQKQPYVPPGITVVLVAAERGYATSTHERTLMTEFTLRSSTSAESPSTGEDRTDQGWLF